MMNENSSQMVDGRFEIERDGQVSYLAYQTDSDGWISLLHTEVAPSLRGRGLANELAGMALGYAKEHHLRVEIVCPMVFHYLLKHPEYKSLVGKRSTGASVHPPA
jgi:hypothetical protein